MHRKENRVAQQQLISLGYSQQQELIQGIEQLKKDHDHLAEKSKTILAALETFESKQSNAFLAIEKLSTLHNAYVLEARLVKSFFLYFMTIIILHMLTSTRQTYSIRSRLYLELGVTLLIKIVVLRYGNDVEQQQWIIDNIRLLFIILASCQPMNAIYTYRDYDSLNHQMLQTLVDKVNKLRNKNDDAGYNDDVDWSSWIDSVLVSKY
ncbi:protein gamete expressed 1 [Tanacetum coccineum]